MMVMVSAWIFHRVINNNSMDTTLKWVWNKIFWEKPWQFKFWTFFFNQWPLLMNHQLGGILQIQKSSPSHLSYFRDTLITMMKKMVCKECFIVSGMFLGNNSSLSCCVMVEKRQLLDRYWDPIPGQCCSCIFCKLQVFYRKPPDVKILGSFFMWLGCLNAHCAETSVDVIRSSWYNKHSLMIYLNVSDVLQWNPNKLNLQGKQKLVSKIR